MSARHLKFMVALATALAWVLVDASGPSNGSLAGYLARQLGCFAWGLFWLTRMALWCVARVRQRPERASGAGLLLELGLVVCAATLVHSSTPMQVRFSLSEPALTRYADAVQRGEAPAASWVGLYRVHRATRTESGGVELDVEYGVWRAGSFVYAPVPPVSAGAFTVYTPLRAHWYARLDSD